MGDIMFSGRAAVGAWLESEGASEKLDVIKLCVVRELGMSGGRPMASVEQYEASRPLDEEAAWEIVVRDKASEAWATYVLAERYEKACEERGCTAEQLPRVLAEDFVREHGGDVYAAVREICPNLDVSRGEPSMRRVRGGANGGYVLECLLNWGEPIPPADRKVLDVIWRLTSTWHDTARERIDPEDVERAVSVLESSPGPDEAVRMVAEAADDIDW